MTDDELTRRLRAARPATAADDGWATTPAGDETLAAVVGRPAEPARVTRLRVRGTVASGLLAAAAITVALAVGIGGDRPTGPQAAPGSGRDGATSPAAPTKPTGPVPAAMSLASYDSCAVALAGLRGAAADNIDAYRPQPYVARAALQSGAAGPLSAGKVALDHSGTNNQEIGVDEPDLVKTDGTRVVSVSGGSLRVADVASRRITGTLDLTMYAGAQDAQLLVDGDRALVLLGADTRNSRLTGDLSTDPASANTYLLVDLGSARPKVLSAFRPRGTFVDAKLVAGRVRLVVSSAPTLVAPRPDPQRSLTQLAAWRSTVERTPVTAWLPDWTLTTGGTTTTGRVPCTSLSHPAAYTGARLTSVYTVDLTRDAAFDTLRPATLAADSSTVYATARSVYLTSATCPAFVRCTARTEIHRFDIAGAGPPVYRGSGSVAGGVLDAYSMSEYRGSLRVVTTVTTRRSTTTSVLALDIDTLATQGAVGGLGRGEEVYGVRFTGPLVYLVTFRQTDPLYVVDLANPAKPVATGQLKVTGYSDYLHLVAAGRLLGVGAEASRRGTNLGAQVSLFDVDDPARPARLDRVFRKNADTSDVADPHAFLYWPATRTAFVPLRDWNRDDGRSRLLVVRVGADSLRTAGELVNPTAPTADGYDSGIVRALVIGDSVWTMSSSGLQVSSLADLQRQAWIAF